MSDTVYNLFLYVEGGLIKQLGIAIHELYGTDQQKVTALQMLVDADYKTAPRVNAKPGFGYSEYESMMRLGHQLEVFEPLFRQCNTPINPLVVITPIVDELPRVLAVTGIGALNLDDFKGTPLEEPGMMADYLKTYITDAGFDFPRLINDDYFLAIKLLFNARHYVSAAKLLVSAIDTMAVADAGDVKDSFMLWLNTYADLHSLGITSKELWEFRNGLLHMTNLNSRDVAKGNTAPLIFYVGEMEGSIPPSRTGAKYFNLKSLIDVIAAAISRWIETYNVTPEKFGEFVTRYDLTISDSRLAYFSVGPQQAPQV
ncbi:MAG: hypothetical protein ACRYFU_00210 [Janthinobacterium lividum]